MRSLSSFNNEFVFGMGWIDQWMDLDDDQVRYVIKNPIFKKPNKNFLFKDLPILTKEDHINLFLSKQDVNDIIIYTRKNAPLEKYEKIKDNLFATVKFVAEVISVKKDKNDKIIEGNPDKIKFVTDSWKFTKSINQKSPNWYLSEIIGK